MPTVTIAEIADRLREWPAEKLAVVYDFVSYLSEREWGGISRETAPRAVETMFASEAVPGRDWNTPDEDAARANW